MGSYLSTPKTEKVSEDGENEFLKYGLSSMQGWRSTMEDAHAAHLDLDSSTSFFGVYDGHGGKAVALFCAKYLHQQVLQHEAYLAGDLGTSLQQAFLRMDEMIHEESGKKELAILGGKIEQTGEVMEDIIEFPEDDEANGHADDCALEKAPLSVFRGPTAGSTACVAIIRNNQLVVANAGDSRCVLSQKGQAYSLTRDHKPNLETEKDRILKAGGFVQCGRVNGSLNLSRAIGDVDLKKNESLPAEKQILTANPDLNTVELCNADEFLVLACDGIWESMSSQQLVDFVRDQLKTERKLSVVCERVFDRCIAPSSNDRKGRDNMTMILVQFKKPLGCGGSTQEKPPLLSYPDPISEPDSDSDDDDGEEDEIPAKPETSSSSSDSPLQ